MRDYVKCTNCGYEGTVEMGAEACPKCKMKGCLAWVDGKPQEVEE